MVICLGWPSPATSSSLPAAPPILAGPDGVGVGHTSPLIWPCSDWGLPCRRCYQRRGGLLPHRFTLTRRSLALAPGGLFSVALSVALRRPGVTWQSPWSSDFPRAPYGARDHHARPAAGQRLERRAVKASTSSVSSRVQLAAPCSHPASPTRAKPSSACRTNGCSDGSADFHWPTPAVLLARLGAPAELLVARRRGAGAPGPASPSAIEAAGR